MANGDFPLNVVKLQIKFKEQFVDVRNLFMYFIFTLGLLSIIIQLNTEIPIIKEIINGARQALLNVGPFLRLVLAGITGVLLLQFALLMFGEGAFEVKRIDIYGVVSLIILVIVLLVLWFQMPVLLGGTLFKETVLHSVIMGG